MLNNLDNIPWGELEHAYGDASDVPSLIRSLLDQNPKIRSNTMRTLYSNVFHQGSRYPATPYVIPFLIELCESPDVFDRGELLSFWGSLITGYFSVQERPSWSDGTMVFGFGDPEELDLNEPYSKALYEIYQESLKGAELLFHLLQEDDIGIRVGAAWVLACLPTIADRSIPILRSQLLREESGWVRAAIAFTLGELGDCASLGQLLVADNHDAVQCMAACQLARIAPKENLVDPLLRFIEQPIDGYGSIPGAGGDSAGDAAFSIMYLPKETRIQALPEIFERLEQARSFATMPFVNALLSASFDPSSNEVTEFTSLQRQVLLALLNCQELWTIANLSSTFTYYGLPFSREKCAKMLGVKVANDDALSKLSVAVTFADIRMIKSGFPLIDNSAAAIRRDA